ncbi:nitrate ABC transporter substrate-binding protein [Devosia limi DSM 17137]|uniref:NitT/TauT family transport system substrate-binding protein n=1 Tax=Devosia limi DSM 17137 TaxID=1121477 RepID=A0A0F5LN14_9HYPH|nr:ABC transporter substrate-binding protein [Devosia limi]KKB83713.1 nitrate ABC transporter substrate-binding protein [Devosia limi DSM 17137]SHE73187.1 NitT/TauT family transport system substrate-binding protein [Devosia limi DSM 17137]
MTDTTRAAGMRRRTFLQVSAAGLVSATTLGGISRAYGAPYGNFTWISPRGSLEVLDDYGLWVGKKMGYFGDLAFDTQPGPSDGTAVVKFVDVGQADMGYPSPGVFSFALENGMDLKSVFHMGALDTFSLAFRKGEGTNDLKTLEGKTILLGSAAWQSIVDPMLAVQGVDVSKVNYVEAGWPTWATALQAGQGDAALSWEGLRAEWIANGLDFEYWLGVKHSPLFANTFVVRAADLDDADKKEFLGKYLRGWAMGMEFAYHNPRAAVEAVFEQFPTLANNLGPQIGTVSILQQLAVNRGDMDKRAGWGDHDMAKWQTFFDSIYELGQVTKAFKAEDIATNELVAAANDFDAAKVKADADAYVLSEPFAALDVEAIKAGLYDQAVR